MALTDELCHHGVCFYRYHLWVGVVMCVILAVVSVRELAWVRHTMQELATQRLRSQLFLLILLMALTRGVYWFVVSVNVDMHNSVGELFDYVNAFCDMLTASVDLLLVTTWVNFFWPKHLPFVGRLALLVNFVMYSAFLAMAILEWLKSTGSSDTTQAGHVRSATFAYDALVITVFSLWHTALGAYVCRLMVQHKLILPAGSLGRHFAHIVLLSAVCTSCYFFRGVCLLLYALNWGPDAFAHPYFSFGIGATLILPSALLLWMFGARNARMQQPGLLSSVQDTDA
eukprot:TRINITY_DN10932_c0_g1_i1.p1 TRINITY_DN10932_c0_g1~~TRINITY_DN10932_c0_g1_i1.p1  ORF type:complete len:285 (+),score=67.16 TRINITY_DN10932_c0_g1_i1:229-1083(+)